MGVSDRESDSRSIIHKDRQRETHSSSDRDRIQQRARLINTGTTKGNAVRFLDSMSFTALIIQEIEVRQSLNQANKRCLIFISCSSVSLSGSGQDKTVKRKEFHCQKRK